MLGRSIKQIADVLDRSVHLDHVKSLHAKLGARSRGSWWPVTSGTWAGSAGAS